MLICPDASPSFVWRAGSCVRRIWTGKVLGYCVFEQGHHCIAITCPFVLTRLQFAYLDLRRARDCEKAFYLSFTFDLVDRVLDSNMVILCPDSLTGSGKSIVCICDSCNSQVEVIRACYMPECSTTQYRSGGSEKVCLHKPRDAFWREKDLPQALLARQVSPARSAR